MHYVFQGLVRRYRPDFLVRLASGATRVLEVKGKDTPQDRAKRASLEEWIAAVNEHGGFGRWSWAVSFSPSDEAALLVQPDTPSPGARAPLTPPRTDSPPRS